MDTLNDTTPRKCCAKCKTKYPSTTEYFQRNRYNPDGLRRLCKSCENEARRQRYAKNPDKARECARLYYAANVEKARGSYKLWVQANPERRQESKRQWAQAHPEKRREAVRHRRAQRVNIHFDFTAERERIALDYFNGCCAVCNRQLQDLFGTHTVHLDHWIPLSKGGSTTLDNMIPLCGGRGGCNQSKGAKEAAEWLTSRYGKRKGNQILARINAYFEWVKATD